MDISYFILAIVATTIGAISGMGGGIIIKPVMDAVSGLPVETINFMSGCTVLSMSMVSTWRSRKEEWDYNIHLAVGAAIGGIIGKNLFRYLPGNTALVQSTMLFFLYLGIFTYVKKKDKIRPLFITRKDITLVIGLMLGCLASFLSIGGGAINMAVLFFFLGSAPKIAAKQSLFIILLSQLTSFITTMITGVPPINLTTLGYMVIGGCCGAIIGKKISNKYSNEEIEGCFLKILVFIILLSVWNVINILH